MVRVLIGAVIILHGLVHLWFIALALKWVEFKPEMGWTTRSWLFTPLVGDGATRKLVSVLLGLVLVVMVVGGAAFLFGAAWASTLLTGAAAASIAVIVLFWDGSFENIVGKGLVAVLIDAAILFGMSWLG